MRFYTASKLGSKRTYTPEGFLVCLDVPIARTGEMIYAGIELPELEAGPDGLIRVIREPDEVFRPESIASFVGRPVTNDHPPEMVGPANYRRYASGAGANVRRGEGAQADLLVADLMICEPEAIRAVENGKDEISNGYDAEYEQVAPGIYRQVAITGNHIAIVDEGRCGARCSIGDSAEAVQATITAQTMMGQGGAGIALRNDKGDLLFLKRQAGAVHGGTWCFPGGKIDDGETSEQAARRELSEEAGLRAGPLRKVDERALDAAAPGTFTTFTGVVDGVSTPRLNDEHDAFTWAALDAPPQPLHPGVEATLREKRDALTFKTVPVEDAAARPRKRKSRDMAPKKLKGSMLDKLRRAFAAKDEAGFEEAMAETQEAVEATQEEQEKAEFAAMIGEAVAEAIAPIAGRLDTVETEVNDRKARDASMKDDLLAALKSTYNPGSNGSIIDPTKDGSSALNSDPTDGSSGQPAASSGGSDPALANQLDGTADNEALAAFLKAKGMSDEDVAEAVAMIKKDASTDIATDDEGSSWSAPGGSTGRGDDPVSSSNPSAGAADQKGTADSAALLTAFRDTIAKAEIIFPGVKVPAFDAKATSKSTMDAMCALRRRALQSAFDSAERKGNVAPFLPAKPDIAKMTCDAVTMAFGGAAELAKRANTVAPNIAEVTAATRDAVRGSVKTMQSAADALWKRS